MVGASQDDSGRGSDGSLERDPVRQRRRLIARWTTAASRAGYSLYGLAIALFVGGSFAGWNGGFSAAVTVCLVLGSVLLAPAIVLGYAIKAAEREEADLERRSRGGTRP